MAIRNNKTKSTACQCLVTLTEISDVTGITVDWLEQNRADDIRPDCLGRPSLPVDVTGETVAGQRRESALGRADREDYNAYREEHQNERAAALQPIIDQAHREARFKHREYDGYGPSGPLPGAAILTVPSPPAQQAIRRDVHEAAGRAGAEWDAANPLLGFDEWQAKNGSQVAA